MRHRDLSLPLLSESERPPSSLSLGLPWQRGGGGRRGSKTPPPHAHTVSHTHGPVFKSRHFFWGSGSKGKGDTPSHFTPHIPLQASLRWNSQPGPQTPRLRNTPLWRSGLTLTTSEVYCQAPWLVKTRKKCSTGFKHSHEPGKNSHLGTIRVTQDVSPDPQQLTPWLLSSLLTVGFSSNKFSNWLQIHRMIFLRMWGRASSLEPDGKY